MGVSQDGDGSGIGVDCSVGTIVWVRRRNGSWWPGRILGPEELSVSHLMSPRSGTPVKLLGREDASVDWYNLEKSKRVKAFRCGEFDACIEKAEASLGVPIKKREKYARREDAILHALELERKQLEMRQQKQAIVSNGITGNSIVALKREFKNISSLDAVTRNDDSSTHSKYSIHNSPTLTKKADLLDDEENMNNSRSINEEKSNKQLRWEEGISGAIHRVRGLRDFGLRVAPKKKPPPSVAWSDTKEPVENNVDSIPCAGHTVRTSGHISSCNDTFSIHRKRPLDGPPIEESLVKKRDRRRPLVQVLQSSAKSQAFGSHLDHCADLAPVHGEKHHVGGIQRAKQRMCVYLPPDSFDSHDNQGYSSDDMRTPATQFVLDNSLDPSSSLVEDFTSGMIEMDESDSSPRDYLESDMEEGDILEDTGQLLASGPKENDSSASHVSEESEDMDNDDIPCSGPSGYISHLHPYEQTAVAPAQVGVSKWHMKGKRNNRNLVRRPVELRNDKICTTGFETYDVSVRETIYGAKCGTLKIGTEPANHRNAEQAFYHINEDDYALEDDLIGEDILQEQMNVYQNQKHSLVSKATMDLGRSRIGFNNLESDSRLVSTLDWEADGLSHGARRKFWQEFDEFYDPVYDSYISIEMDSNLFNVDLKVKASYQGEHVPLVSLMSRLNGKAIIGHPIQIEILEDDLTSQYFPSNCPDGSSTRQPVWRTGRRTAMQRVPRSNPVTSSWENDEAGGSHYPERGSHYSEREDKPSLFMYFSHSKNLSRSTKKRVFSAHRPPLGNSQKSQKRVSSSSQKTRTLSSFASVRRLGRGNGETRFTRSNDLLGGLMKPVGQVPLITCIPVKVAFSRILEAIGRSSTTTSHHVRMANLAVRDQS